MLYELFSSYFLLWGDLFFIGWDTLISIGYPFFSDDIEVWVIQDIQKYITVK